MAEKHEKLLSELEFRMHQLVFLCDTLNEENQKLRHQLNDRDVKVIGLYAELEQLNSKYDSLKFANSMSAGTDAESVDEAKKRLSRLVQDVDKCIALLKQ